MVKHVSGAGIALVLAALSAGGSVGAAEPELVGAFIFGSRDIQCEVPNEPGTNYTMVHHAANSCDAHDALAYDAGAGYGYDVIDPGATGRNCGAQFGPFDDSPNGRGGFADTCPNHIYNSMIGFKNFATNCDVSGGADPDEPCSPTIPADGGAFRVDVPNGYYRFVAAVGDQNRHVHRLVAEDGGVGPPAEMGPNHVVLVNNHNQAEWGTRTYAAVGFGDGVYVPPGGGADGPTWLNMNSLGQPSICPPNSPVLEVTQGYIRVHQLQGRAADGAAGGMDRNGGDIALLELWKVADPGADPVPTPEPDLPGAVGVRDIQADSFAPGDAITVVVTLSQVPGTTTLRETIPAGWEVIDPDTWTPGETLDLTVEADGDVSYVVVAGPDCVSSVAFSGEVDASPLGCVTAVGGDTTLDLDSGLEVAVNRSIEGASYRPGELVTVSLTSQPSVFADTTVTEYLPEGFSVVDDGGGTVGAGTISFVIAQNVGIPIDPGLTAVRGGGSTQPEPFVAEGPLVDGALCFNDRNHVWAEVAGTLVEGATYLRVSNNDRTTSDYTLDVQAAVDGTLYLLIDNRVGGGDGGTPPDLSVNMQWVIDQGFADTEAQIGIDESDDGDIDQRFRIFAKELPAATIETLGSQLESLNNYGVAFIPSGGPEPTTVSYTIESAGCGPAEIDGESLPDGGCPTEVGGDRDLGCVEFRCDPAPEETPPELVGAFAFGSRNLSCETYNDPSVPYTMVHHSANNCDVHNSIAYSDASGYGFVVIDPGNTGRNCGAQFGPFDDSPNSRSRLGDDCAEELYDSFIGFKNHPTICDQTVAGSLEDPCLAGDTIPPDGADYIVSGGIFRVDVPPGVYRFVAVLGESDNPHASRMLAEDGGAPSIADPVDPVTLVSNHDQAQYTHGEVRADCPGCAVFARVGFNCRIPPLGDGLGADPQFVNYGIDGLPAGPGDDGEYGTDDDPAPESPELVVESGYIHFHLLQGNSNGGPGGKDGGVSGDPNGPDIVLLEVWRVSDVPDPCEGVDADTHCAGLTVEGPEGNVPGTYVAMASASDDSGDEILFTFTASNGVDDDVVVGPQTEDTASFELTEGDWTISVEVDDACPEKADDNTCVEPVTVVSPGVGPFLRGDGDGNGNLEITDAIFVLNFLFLGGPEPGCQAAADPGGEGTINLTSAVYVLNFLFLGGPPPVAPYPDCGRSNEASDLALGCITYESCP